MDVEGGDMISGTPTQMKKGLLTYFAIWSLYGYSYSAHPPHPRLLVVILTQRLLWCLMLKKKKFPLKISGWPDLGMVEKILVNSWHKITPHHSPIKKLMQVGWTGNDVCFLLLRYGDLNSFLVRFRKPEIWDHDHSKHQFRLGGSFNCQWFQTHLQMMIAEKGYNICWY